MFIDTLDRFDELCARFGGPPALGLTLDIGHCRCLEPQPVAECVRRAASRLEHIQMEDMRRGSHEHLEFGHGETDFPPVLGALLETGYRGLVSVRHHRALALNPKEADDPRVTGVLDQSGKGPTRAHVRHGTAASGGVDDFTIRPARALR